MPTRSRLSTGFLANQVIKALAAEPRTTAKFAQLQMVKETFNLRHPFGVPSGKAGTPQLICMRITDRCNLRCHSCGQWGDNGYLLDTPLPVLKERETPVDRHFAMVDAIVEAGWKPMWYFWGGEPMLYPGIMDLLKYIHERDMPITIVSNSTRMADRAEELAQYCKVIYLSLDGPNAEIHNTQRPGLTPKYDNFAEVEAALEAFRRIKTEKKLVYPYIVPLTCITTYNIDHMVDLYRYSREYADAHIFYLTWWINQQEADNHTADFERRFGFQPKSHYGWIGEWKDFDHGVIYDRFEEMEQMFFDGDKRCAPIMMPRLKSREDIQRYYRDHTATFGYNQCVSIFMEMQVDSNGDVSLCRDYHDYTLGNIKTEDIRDLWNSEKARKFRSSINQDGIMPVCRRCCGLMGF